MTNYIKDLGIKTIDISNKLENELKEGEKIERFISNILGDEIFNRQNNLFNKRDLNEASIYNFVSIDLNTAEPYAAIMLEKEFFKIVGANLKRIYKTSGAYQEHLYGHYMKAKAENDYGYISDILKKAVELKNNIEETENIMKNKIFMRKWRKNFGKISPVKILKDTGSMRLINIIKREQI